MNKKLTLLATLALSAAPLFAQEIIELEEITLSANLDAIEVDRTGASVEVIEGEEIEKAQSLTLSEFLGQHAGVSINRSGPIGGNASVLIRGARQYEVKVLVDGIDISDPSLPQSYFNFSGMGMGDIGRIEIVKGSQSSIYGGSAVGGVVSISTKEPEVNGFSGSAAIEYGSYNTGTAALTLAHAGENHAVALTYSKTKSDGFSAADENAGNTETDGFEGERWSVNASYDLTSNLTIGLSGFTASNEAEYDNAFGTVSDANNLANDTQNAARAYVKYEDDRTSHELAFSAMDATREYTTDYGTGGYDGSRAKISYLGSAEVSENLHFSFGLESLSEERAATGSYGTAANDISIKSALFGLSASPTDRIDIDVSARVDDHSEFGQHESYRVTLAARPMEGTTVKASASTGYRAPSIGELYSQYGGNPDLNVESTTSFEIGVTQEIGSNATLSATLFRMITEDMIVYDSTYTYNNLDGESVRQGVELSGTADISDTISASVGYSYIDAKNADGDRLARIPKHELNIGLDAEVYQGVTLGLEAKMVRDVIESSTVELDDYNLVNARLGYEIGDGEIYARVENLLDEEYQTATGYGTSDRAFYVGYSVNF